MNLLNAALYLWTTGIGLAILIGVAGLLYIAVSGTWATRLAIMVPALIYFSFTLILLDEALYAIDVQAHPSHPPITDNGTSEGRQENRRVMIIRCDPDSETNLLSTDCAQWYVNHRRGPRIR